MAFDSLVVFFVLAMNIFGLHVILWQYILQFEYMYKCTYFSLA